MPRHAWVEVDLGAIRHNVSLLADLSRPAQLCAVVKADGYGHGAVPVAKEALDAGAAWLGVALVEEGVALRAAGIDAPILLLSEPPPDVMAERTRPAHADPLSPDGVAAAAARGGPGRAPVAGARSRSTPACTGWVRSPMTPSPSPRSIVERALAGARGGVHPLRGGRRARQSRTPPSSSTGSMRVLDALTAGASTRASVTPPTRPAPSPTPRPASTWCAAASRSTASHPGPEVAGMVDLRPAMSVRGRGHAREAGAGRGRRVATGCATRSTDDAIVATVPLGYADGVRRASASSVARSSSAACAGRSVGAVTMDQFIVDCGDRRPAVAVGDEVVLIGRQGDEEITADEWGGGSTRSATRSCAASDRGCPACTGTARSRDPGLA